jgi:3-oxoacyl-[acyl-carrier protein] reductase
MRIALVTGGSRGIGKAICIKLAQMGMHVIINYRSNEVEALDTLEKVKACGTSGELLCFDVGDQAAFEKAMDDWYVRNPDKRVN